MMVMLMAVSRAILRGRHFVTAGAIAVRMFRPTCAIGLEVLMAMFEGFLRAANSIRDQAAEQARLDQQGEDQEAGETHAQVAGDYAC